MTTLTLATEYRDAGLSVLPIRTDGSKAAAVLWAERQVTLPNDQELQSYFRNGYGIGIACGRGSGDLEVLDHDREDLFPHSWNEFLADVEAAQPGLMAKLTIIKTPRGHHVYYRCEAASGNEKLAKENVFDPAEGKIVEKAKFETRGPGGYVVTVGSPAACHPDRKTYEHLSGPPITALTTITTAEREILFRVARSFNRVVDDAAVIGQQQRPGHNGQAGLSPGDDYNARATWREILEPHGWQPIYDRGDVTHWKRPGKSEPGTSATTGLKSTSGNELLCVFSSNAHPFEIPMGRSCGTYTKFAAFALLNHKGDYSEAARALARQGYGERPVQQIDDQPEFAKSFREPDSQYQPDDRKKFVIRQISSREFDGGDYHTEYLIEDILAARQSLVIAAALKSMKTSLAVALAVALALGRQFLGKFWIPSAANVLIMSGESGLSTLQSTGRRVAASYGYSLAEVGRLFWTTDLPRLGHIEHLEALREALTANEIEVLICDPLYFMLPGNDAGNLMIVGGYLRTLSALCDELGVTLIVVHHIKKTGIENRHDPPELSHISWSGTAEWARQWLLLSRRRDYRPGTGEHELWMVSGGSAGHSGLHALNIYEGVGDERTWHVEVLNPDEVRKVDDDAKDRARESAELAKVEKAKRAICSAMLKHPGGETAKAIKDMAGVNGTIARLAFASLIEEGHIVPCDISKGNRKTPYDGFRLNDESAK